MATKSFALLKIISNEILKQRIYYIKHRLLHLNGLNIAKSIDTCYFFCYNPLKQ
ncbi:hypothetical protein [Helicobacter bilis]|uniref:hypothetical protein n=1 Tax=Helicobacter bilis TaxID=37372 RepID=UPI000AB61F4F|nr:hypothetical protein [Helicobacter bilis]